MIIFAFESSTRNMTILYRQSEIVKADFESALAEILGSAEKSCLRCGLTSLLGSKIE